MIPATALAFAKALEEAAKRKQTKEAKKLELAQAQQQQRDGR